MQDQCTAALVRAEYLLHCPVLLCKTGSQHDCANAVTPMEICSSYSCTVMLHQCTAAVVRAKISSPLFSAALQIRLRACLCHCKYTYGDLLFIQLYSDPTQVLCNTVPGKKQSPLLSPAVQNRFTARLCQCNFTYGDLLFIQVCSDPTPEHCNTVFGKKQAHYSVLLCKSG